VTERAPEVMLSLVQPGQSPVDVGLAGRVAELDRQLQRPAVVLLGLLTVTEQGGRPRQAAVRPALPGPVTDPPRRPQREPLHHGRAMCTGLTGAR